MKTKKILFLAVMFLFLSIIFAIPNNVFAEEMCEEVKQLLNDKGELVVTHTTMSPDKETLIRHFVWSKNSNIEASNYNEEDSTCWILHNPTMKLHTVPVVFEEQYSDAFKTILKNGKVELPNSSKNISAEWIERYISQIQNDKYVFIIDTYVPLGMGQDTCGLISDDLTKATIIMREKENYGKVERHIVEFVKITEQSENFKSYLNKNGKILINGIKPETEKEFQILFDLLIREKDEMEASYPSEDFSSFDFTIDGETHTVDVIYNYDNSIKLKLQDLVKNFPEDIEYFQVKDMELINYWVNTIGNDDVNTFAGYSGELKSYINNYNVKLKVDARAGFDEPFKTGRAGFAMLTYNDIAYYVTHWLGSEGEHIIYVPDETGDSKEELIAAAQKRINEYLGKEGVATVSYGGPAFDAWVDSYYETTRPYWSEMDPNLTKEDWLNDWAGLQYEDFGNEVIGIDGVIEQDDTYIVTVKVNGKEEKHNIIIRKDTSKMILPTYATADMVTDVTISSTATEIPLDTIVESEKLTSGTEYDKVIKKLQDEKYNVENSVTYDLKLYSSSIKDYITKLEDGSFEVKLPIPEELKGKNLIACYVDTDGNIKEYELNDKEVFTTDHFSIYTLAEAPEPTQNENQGNEGFEGGKEEQPKDDEKQEIAEDKKEDVGSTNNGAGKTEDTANSENPKTGDNIILFVIIFIVSVVGILVTTKMKKQNKKD